VKDKTYSLIVVVLVAWALLVIGGHYGRSNADTALALEVRTLRSENYRLQWQLDSCKMEIEQTREEYLSIIKKKE